jgi:hypothetical protein
MRHLGWPTRTGRHRGPEQREPQSRVPAGTPSAIVLIKKIRPIRRGHHRRGVAIQNLTSLAGGHSGRGPLNSPGFRSPSVAVRIPAAEDVTRSSLQAVKNVGSAMSSKATTATGRRLRRRLRNARVRMASGRRKTAPSRVRPNTTADGGRCSTATRMNSNELLQMAEVARTAIPPSGSRPGLSPHLAAGRPPARAPRLPGRRPLTQSRGLPDPCAGGPGARAPCGTQPEQQPASWAAARGGQSAGTRSGGAGQPGHRRVGVKPGRPSFPAADRRRLPPSTAGPAPVFTVLAGGAARLKP